MAEAARGAGQPSWALDPLQVSVTYGGNRLAASASGQGSSWFGPLVPLAPVAPREVAGRQWDFPAGFNLQTRARAYEAVTFTTLRALADGYDLLRLVIETRKDQLCRLSWTVRPRDKKAKGPAIQAKVDNALAFWRKPDRVTRWRAWLRQVLEDHFVIDAATLFRQRTRDGSLYALLPVDGATIKRVIDDWGRTPQPSIVGGVAQYPVAYQQVLKGMPAVDYSVREILYCPYNVRTGRPYGYSPVEQVLMTVNIALRRQLFQLSYFTEGNVPEALIGVPDQWTPDQIASYQSYWDTMMEGNLAQRRHAKFVPGGAAKLYVPTKEPELKNVFDEWLARLVCFAFNVSPQSLVSMMNRATAETQKESSEEEGLEPIKAWLKDLIDDVLEEEQDSAELEFEWAEEIEIDQQVQTTILKDRVGSGIMVLNEARGELGLEPYPDEAANKPMVLTTLGYVPIEANTIEGKQATIDAFGPPVVPGAPPASEGNDDDTAPKPKEEAGKLAKAPFVGRPAPVLFPRKLTRRAEADLKGVFQDAFKRILGDVEAATETALAKAADGSAQAADILAAADPTLTDDEIAAIVDELVRVALDSALEALDGVGVGRDELFDQINARAAAWAKDYAAELVTGIDQTTRDGLQAAIANAIDDGQGLDEITAAIAELGVFSDERAELIAATEVSRANSEGALEGYRSARDDAGVAVKKEWLLGPNPCEDCQANADAGAIDLDDEFPSGDDCPPAHPRCECAISPVVDE